MISMSDAARKSVAVRPSTLLAAQAARGRFGPILYVIGLLLIGLGGVMLVPALFDLSAHNSDWRSFIAAGITTVLFGADWCSRTAARSSASTSLKASC
jgi:hypothetical protein